MNQQPLEIEEKLASAQARSRFFWLLADCLLNGPQADSWHLIKNGATEEGSGPLDDAWNNLVQTAKSLDAATWQALAVEHTRLFLGLKEGSVPPPPFESAWREGLEAGEALAQVSRSYADAGFADIDLSAGPQDHLGVELKFMAILALREAEAWQQEDEEAATEWLSQQQAFLDRHLLAWVPRWADALAQRTQEKIYWALARLILIGVTNTAEDLEV